MAATEEEQRKIQEQAQEEQAQEQVQGAATAPATQEEPAVKRERVTATHITAPTTDPSQSAYAQYMANYPKYDEEAEQRKLKRARSAMLLGAISDGISAMSNLYATKRYAPSAMNAKSTTLSDRAKKVYDEIEKTRQANRKAWQQGADKAAGLLQKNTQNDANMRLKADQFNATQDLKAAQFNAESGAKDVKDNAVVEKTKAQTATEKARKVEVEGRTANAATLNEARVGTEKSKQEKNNRSGGSGSGRYYGTFRDKEYATKADYETAVLLAADEYGIDTTEDKNLVGDQRDIAINRLATACEKEYRKRKGQGGSTSQSDDNTEHTWDIGGSGKGDTGHTWGKKK